MRNNLSLEICAHDPYSQANKPHRQPETESVLVHPGKFHGDINILHNFANV
jgi:hypothetical protein